MKKIDFETLWGGLFGILAVLSAVMEMVFNGISATTIFGAIKDIAGTLVVIMVFLVAIKQARPNKDKDFDSVFYSEMENVISKYEPLIKRAEDASTKYMIATHLDAIFTNTPGAYYLWFEVKDKKEIQFSISKTVFMGRTKEDFATLQNTIATRIGSKVVRSYEMIENYETNTNGIKIIFKNSLLSGADAKQLANIIDYILFLYIAENKK